VTHRPQSPGAHRTGRWLTARRLIAISVGLVLSALSALFLATVVDLNQAFALLRVADPLLASLAVLTLACSIVVRTARWGVLLPSPHGGVAVRVRTLIPIVLIGYLGNSIAPLRFGDALRAGVAARRFRLGLPETLGSVIAERLIDTAALTVVVVGTATWWHAPIWLVQSSALIAVVSAIVLLILYGLAAGTGRVGSSAGRLAGHIQVATHYGRRLLTGARVPPPRLAASAALSVTAWLIDGVTFWLCAQALAIDAAWPVTMLIAGAAALGMAAPSGPAAVGVFELAGTAAGIALGMPAESALALVVFAHVLTVTPLVLTGLLSLTTISASDSRWLFATSRGAESRSTQVEVKA
jgi:uncharacterized membrane protein YbhN (UPF0104 family)